MTQILLRASDPVTLVGGGPVDPRQLEVALRLAPEAVAADGGGNLALPGGRRFRKPLLTLALTWFAMRDRV